MPFPLLFFFESGGSKARPKDSNLQRLGDGSGRIDIYISKRSNLAHILRLKKKIDIIKIKFRFCLGLFFSFKARDTIIAALQKRSVFPQLQRHYNFPTTVLSVQNIERRGGPLSSLVTPSPSAEKEKNKEKGGGLKLRAVFLPPPFFSFFPSGVFREKGGCVTRGGGGRSHFQEDYLSPPPFLPSHTKAKVFRKSNQLEIRRKIILK